MTGALSHLLIAPIVVPLFAGALLMMFDERRHLLKAMINIASTLALLIIAVLLVRIADTSAAGDSAAMTGVYLLGNWPAPFGIVLVLDRLAGLMVLLGAVLAVAALVFSLARWHRGGPHFHTLFQFLLMESTAQS